MRRSFFKHSIAKSTLGLLLISACSFGIGSTSRAQKESAFLDLKIGMDGERALSILQRPMDLLTNAPLIAGKRIINDTLAFGNCNIPMRRSIALDSGNMLRVVGLTYRGTSEDISGKEACALSWLTNKYGPPTGTDTLAEVPIYKWVMGSTQLTLETKGYNEKDFFILIYYYALKQ